ncbi:hypothetical protein BKA56DRAFT_717943 [Ilyonectria sp. MPI-CAGE-AT-0026]|nr:hypothetical protein BKA56DRAFT_717943 [Ilyonectria sp. MPI-CAGE-AT-0026]
MSSSEADDHDHEGSEGDIPQSNVTQTQLWLSVEYPSILTPAEIVTANNLGIVAQQNEKFMSMITKFVAYMTRLQMSRRSSVAGSRRSSVSAGSTRKADDATEAEDQAVEAFNKLREEHFDVIYQASGLSFRQLGDFRCKEFTDSVNERTTGLEDKDARIAAELMGAISDGQAVELHILLSRHAMERGNPKLTISQLPDGDEDQKRVNARVVKEFNEFRNTMPATVASCITNFLTNENAAQLSKQARSSPVTHKFYRRMFGKGNLIIKSELSWERWWILAAIYGWTDTRLSDALNEFDRQFGKRIRGLAYPGAPPKRHVPSPSDDYEEPVPITPWQPDQPKGKKKKKKRSQRIIADKATFGGNLALLPSDIAGDDASEASPGME